MRGSLRSSSRWAWSWAYSWRAGLFPWLLKGTSFLFDDLRDKPHLIVWALMAGMLWAVGNTLTIFAMRNVGLAIAFPLWNTNSLVGLFWGWLLFKELRGSAFKGWSKVLGGACRYRRWRDNSRHMPPRAIPTHQAGLSSASWRHWAQDVMLGTMYIPYRKAYISGMNPLSFVTIFTFGELGTVFLLTADQYTAASDLCSPSCTAPGPRCSGCSLADSAG